MSVQAPEKAPLASGQPTSFRLSAEAGRMLDELSQRLGLKRTAVVEMAIRQLYRKETGRAKPPEKKGEPS